MTISADKILVATPVYDFRLDLAYVSAILNLQRQQKICDIMFVAGNADIRHARNQIAHFFHHKTTLEWLVMIDADMGFSLSDWDTLLSDPNETSAVRGVYAKKERGAAASHGLGFCRIHRNVLSVLAEKFPHYQDEDGERRCDFFGRDNPGVWTSESVGFWRTLEALDVSVHTFTSTTLMHYGRCGYHLQTVSMPL